MAALLECTLASLVFLSRSDRHQNRVLAAYFLIDAITFGSIGLAMMTPGAHSAYGFWMINAFMAGPWFFSYLIVLGTLETPLTRPWRDRRTVIGLVVAGVGLGLFFLIPGMWIGGIVKPTFAEWTFIDGAWNGTYSNLAIVLHLYAVAAAVSAWHRAPTGSAQRTRNGAFALAFGVRDVLVASGFVVYLLSPEAVFYLIPLHMTTVVLLAGYGILRTQLFDIDLKIKWGLSKGTTAGIILVTFFVVSQLVENLASDSLGIVVGSLAAGVLLFFIHPLARLSDRLAHAAMPGVEATSAYLAFRKVEVYQATLEDLTRDGGVSPADRRVLDVLRRRLGLSVADAHAIEAGAARDAPGGTP